MGNVNGNFGASERTREAEVPAQKPSGADGAASTQPPAGSATGSAGDAPAAKEGEAAPPPSGTVGSGKEGASSGSSYDTSIFTEEEIAKMKEWDEEDAKAGNKPAHEQPTGDKPADQPATPPAPQSPEELIKLLPEDMQAVLKREMERRNTAGNIFSKVLDGVPDDDPLRGVATAVGGKIGELDGFVRKASNDFVKLGAAIDELRQLYLHREVETQISEAKAYYAKRIDFDEGAVRQLALSGKIKIGPDMIKNHILRTYRDRIMNAERKAGRDEEAANQRRLANAGAPSGSGDSRVVNSDRRRTRAEELKEVADGLRKRHPGIAAREAELAKGPANVSRLFQRRSA